MATLLERLRAARESWVSTGEGSFEVLLRRPTELQLARWRQDPGEQVLARCLVGWRGITEAELVPGGEGRVPPFDVGACVEYLEDRPAAYAKVFEGLQGLLDARAARTEAVEKK
jgi:hypothetical protein